jgi:hypothetical protein
MSDHTGTEKVHRAIQQLGGERGWVNGARLVRRIADRTGMQHLEIRQALLLLARRGALNSVAPSGDPLGRVAILQRIPDEEAPVPEHELSWRALVLERGLDKARSDALGAIGPLTKGLTLADMNALLGGLLAMSADHKRLAGRDPFEVSAKYLLGSSKILSKISHLLGPMGIDEALLGSRPRYMLAAGPGTAQSALFIENPECFQRVLALGLAEHMIVVATYGYGLSWSGVGREGALDRICLARVAGNPPANLKDVVACEKCYFWGDLDQAGLDIYLALRSRIPHLQLSALYEPMIAALKNRSRSHPYAALADKQGQVPVLTTDGLIASLASSCIERAVDQEVVEDADVVALGRHPLRITGAAIPASALPQDRH